MNSPQSRQFLLAILPAARIASALALLQVMVPAIGCNTHAPGEGATTIYTGGPIITVNDPMAIMNLKVVETIKEGKTIYRAR
jgi:hypothetical protein